MPQPKHYIHIQCTCMHSYQATVVHSDAATKHSRVILKHNVSSGLHLCVEQCEPASQVVQKHVLSLEGDWETEGGDGTGVPRDSPRCVVAKNTERVKMGRC